VSKLARYISALGAVFFAAVTLTACGGIPSNAVVQVGGKSITKDTFTHWMGIAASSSSATTGAPKTLAPDPPAYKTCIAHLRATQAKPAKGQTAPTEAQLKSQCEQEYKQLSQTVLGFLIQTEWLLGEANSLGVKVSDSEVQKQFETIKKQQFAKAGAFQKFLASTGYTPSDLLLRVKVQLLTQKIKAKIEKGKPPTQAQVAKYYNENKSQYGQAEKRDIELILTKTQAQAQKAKSEVSSGKSFATVAKKSSTDPSKTTGGKLAGVAKGQEEKALDSAIFAAKRGVLSGPTKTPFGYYVFEVEKTHASSQQTLAQSEAAIKQQLTSSQGQAAMSAFVPKFQKKWTAKTNCRSGYVVPDCKSYKAPKTPTTATPTPAPQTSTTTPQTTTAKTAAPTTKKK
jgi:foldase protein PrsA